MVGNGNEGCIKHSWSLEDWRSFGQKNKRRRLDGYRHNFAFRCSWFGYPQEQPAVFAQGFVCYCRRAFKIGNYCTDRFEPFNQMLRKRASSYFLFNRPQLRWFGWCTFSYFDDQHHRGICYRISSRHELLYVLDCRRRLFTAPHFARRFQVLGYGNRAVYGCSEKSGEENGLVWRRGVSCPRCPLDSQAILLWFAWLCKASDKSRSFWCLLPNVLQYV